jgi:hypothetical protein
MGKLWRISIFSLAAINAFAWGPDGHMIVAAIAWNSLTPALKTEAARLLKENPYYDIWTKDVAAADKDRIAFITAATWPDEIKGDSNYNNSEGDHPTKGAESGQNIGYDDKLQHRYWHFYDTPFSPDNTSLGKPDDVNALTQIVLFTQALKTSSDDSIRSYDLVWLLHMVGDVHQPLHATSRFDKEDPKGDEGGNLVIICSAAQMASSQSKKCRSELHGFWDSAPGANKGAAAAAQQALKLPKAPASGAGVSDPAKWISESFAQAKLVAYFDPPIGVGDGPFVLTTAYRAKVRVVVDQRLALAGARLANLLKQNLLPSK